MGQKKRIGIIIAAIIVVLLAAGVIGFFLWQQSPSSAPVSEDQTSSAVSSLEPAQAALPPRRNLRLWSPSLFKHRLRWRKSSLPPIRFP